MQSPHGHAPFACRGDVLQSAWERSGFAGSLTDVLQLLYEMSDITVKLATPIEHSRVRETYDLV